MENVRKFGGIRLAILGCGRWGINHVRTAHKILGDNLMWVCDAAHDSEAKVRDISQNIRFTTERDSILQDEEVNAVIIATPAPTHYALAQEALAHRKHVLVEKPLSLSSKEAKKLVDLAESVDRRLMVGHVLLFHPAIRKVKELCVEGKIGNIQYIYSNRLNLGQVREEENILWSFAPHDISVLQYLIGEKPLSIDASGGMFLNDGIEDTTITYLRYPKNVHAHIFVSWLHPFKEHRLVVIGTEAMIVFEDSAKSDRLKYYKKGYRKVNGYLERFDSEFESIPFGNEEPLKAEQVHFFQCIVDNRRPLTDGQHALEVLEILEEAHARIRDGAPQAR